MSWKGSVNAEQVAEQVAAEIEEYATSNTRLQVAFSQVAFSFKLRFLVSFLHHFHSDHANKIFKVESELRVQIARSSIKNFLSKLLTRQTPLILQRIRINFVPITLA